MEGGPLSNASNTQKQGGYDPSIRLLKSIAPWV